jgi:hypothetical protein
VPQLAENACGITLPAKKLRTFMHLDAHQTTRYRRAHPSSLTFLANVSIMNAVMREPYEAPVIPTETIEANLTFLRTSVDEVRADMRGLQADNRSLRDKIDTVRSELIHPIEQVRTELVDKIEQVSALLDKKIDQLAMTPHASRVKS